MSRVIFSSKSRLRRIHGPTCFAESCHPNHIHLAWLMSAVSGYRAPRAKPLTSTLGDSIRAMPRRGCIIRLFVCLFVRLFVRSFVRSFVCSFVRSFVRSFVCLFVVSFVRSFVRLFLCSFVRSFVLSFVCLLFR